MIPQKLLMHRKRFHFNRLTNGLLNHFGYTPMMYQKLSCKAQKKLQIDGCGKTTTCGNSQHLFDLTFNLIC